jgi:hypothetical protein
MRDGIIRNKEKGVEAVFAGDDGRSGDRDWIGGLGVFGLRHFFGLDAVAAGGGGDGTFRDLVEERELAGARFAR